MIINVSDFTGKYALSKGMFTESKLLEYIERYQDRYLMELLGIELFNSFKNDLVNDVPLSPNFKKIYDPFAEDVDILVSRFYRGFSYSGILISNGMKDMLKGFIYYEYAKDLVNQMTPFGNTKPQSENSDIANTLFSMMYNRYNESIVTYQAIQDYIILNQGNFIQGQLRSITMTQPGTNIFSGTYDVTGGSGSGATFVITSSQSGETEIIDIGDPGKDYQIGDQLSVNEGNLDLIVNVDSIGVGDYSSFNGQKKLSAYWL